MQTSAIKTLRYTLIGVVAMLVACGRAFAHEAVGPSEKSRGDPAVFAILDNQNVEPAMVLKRGTTLTKICDVRNANGLSSYRLYWLEHLTQAAIQIHGRAKFVVISHPGDVLGTFDSDMGEHPHCIGPNMMVRTIGSDQHTTSLIANQLPVWLGGGSGFFAPVDKYKGKASVDGIAMPTPVHPLLHLQR